MGTHNNAIINPTQPIKIIPCKYCNCADTHIDTWGNKLYYVKCKVCGQSGKMARTQEAAIYYWNHQKKYAKRSEAESVTQTKIIKYLESIGCFVVKTVATNKSGVPDILSCFNGHFIAIEVKRHGLNATILQQHKMSQIIKAGGIAFTAHSLEEVKQSLPQWLCMPVKLDTPAPQ